MMELSNELRAYEIKKDWKEKTPSSDERRYKIRVLRCKKKIWDKKIGICLHMSIFFCTFAVAKVVEALVT